jgi:hypothetical protein
MPVSDDGVLLRLLDYLRELGRCTARQLAARLRGEGYDLDVHRVNRLLHHGAGNLVTHDRETGYWSLRSAHGTD